MEPTRRTADCPGPLHLANLFEPAYRDTVIDDRGRGSGSRTAWSRNRTQLRLGQAATAVAGDRRQDAGTRVSLNVAPATRTRSVVKNRALAAAYRRLQFGVEVFAPATANTLMAALLVRDLRDPQSAANPQRDLQNPMDLFSDAANQGACGAPHMNPDQCSRWPRSSDRSSGNA